MSFQAGLNSEQPQSIERRPSWFPAETDIKPAAMQAVLPIADGSADRMDPMLIVKDSASKALPAPKAEDDAGKAAPAPKAEDGAGKAAAAPKAEDCAGQAAAAPKAEDHVVAEPKADKKKHNADAMMGLMIKKLNVIPAKKIEKPSLTMKKRPTAGVMKKPARKPAWALKAKPNGCSKCRYIVGCTPSCYKKARPNGCSKCRYIAGCTPSCYK